MYSRHSIDADELPFSYCSPILHGRLIFIVARDIHIAIQLLKIVRTQWV